MSEMGNNELSQDGEEIDFPDEMEISPKYRGILPCMSINDTIKYVNLNYIENSDTASESTICSTTTTSSYDSNDDLQERITKSMSWLFIQNNTSTSLTESPIPTPDIEPLKLNIAVGKEAEAAYNAIKQKQAENGEEIPIDSDESEKDDDEDDEDESDVEKETLDEMEVESLELSFWDDIVQPPKENLLKMLQFMFTNHLKPNVKVYIGDVYYNCHMLALQAFSEYFVDKGLEYEIHIPPTEVSPFAFKKIYDWIIHDCKEIERDGILEIYLAANFLKVKDVMEKCWLILDNDEIFLEDSAYLLYMEARYYGIERVEQMLLSRVCRFFLVFVSSNEFLELSCIELCQLLDSNGIGVNTEVEVFMAVARWLDYDWEQRKQYVLKVAQYVRYSLMPPWFLVTFNRKTGSPEVDRMIDLPEIQKLIGDGISYSTTQLYFNNTQKEFSNFLDTQKLAAPVERQWVYDRRCAHHHLTGCTQMQHLTYDTFLDYLDVIQKEGRSYWTTLEDATSVPEDFKCCKKFILPNNDLNNK